MTSFQKKLAAKILKVGASRVWLDPSKTKDIKNAITRMDVKKLIQKNAIKSLPEKIKLRTGIKKRKRRKGIGSRKGSKYSIWTKKQRWIHTVRPLRKMLKELKSSDQIENATYKKMRSMVKGGMFRSKHHLKIYLEQHTLLKKVSK